MNKLIDFALKNKFAIWLLTIMVTVGGLYSGLNMKQETIPDITIPVVSLVTVYPGATPEEVTDKVTEPIEKAVQNLEGVKTINSSSFENASSIQIEYSYGTDMDKAESNIDEALKNVNLPDEAMESSVMRISINAFPILVMSASSDKQDLAQLTKTMTDSIIPEIEGIEGVSDVQVSGQQVEEVQLVFNKDKMQKLGLTEDTVKGIIQASNISFPLGLFTFTGEQKSVVIDGKVSTIEELNKILIPYTPSTTENGPGQAGGMGSTGQGTADPTANSMNPSSAGQTDSKSPRTAPTSTTTPDPAQMAEVLAAQQAALAAGLPTVSLEEIAKIEVIGEAESISRTNGKESIGLMVVKAPDANTVEVANAVKGKIADFEKEHDGLTIVTTMDQAEPIEASVETMLSKAIFGALFAVVIIMLFLRNIKTTLISVISIPLSILIAMLILKRMDLSLNMMTLGAMTVAIGRVIDDSIVVIENIYRRMALKSEKLTGRELIKSATKEMFIPIMSSTIVTIAVYLPLGLVGGIVGELFLPFALTMVFALLASLLVAVTIVPMLAHSFMNKGINKKHHMEEDKPGKLASWYKGILEWTLNHKAITSIITILMLVGSLFLVPIVGVSFLSSDENKMLILTYSPAPGETLDEVEDAISKAETYFNKQKDVDSYQVSVGGSNQMSMGSSNSAVLYAVFNPDTKDFEDVSNKVVEDIKSSSNSEGEWKSQDMTMSGSSNDITYYVYGDNMEKLEDVVKQIEKLMKDNGNFENIDSTISESYSEYTLVADQEKLAKLGLTAAQIGMALNPNQERPVLTKVEQDGKELNVYIETPKEEVKSIDDLTNKTIQSPLGMEVPIKELVELKEGETSDTVTRRNGEIYVSVSGTLTTDDVSKASSDLQAKVDKIDLPSNMEIGTGGVTEDIAESFTQLGLAMLAAIAIVYFILVLTFGGALAPLAILFSLPFTVIGALVGLLIAGETISVSTLLGVLMLIGIVVTNAIVLIDRVIHKEKEGLSTRAALLEAGTTRLRPILMTAIATIGALIPLALGYEGSGVISKGLGVTVIGGLTSSTLLTLIVVPLVYEFLSKFKSKKRVN